MAGNLPPVCTQDECDRAQPGYYDDPPEQWFVCDKCDGEGQIITGRDIGSRWALDPPEDIYSTCSRCNGAGGWLDDAETDRCPPRTE